MSDFRGFNVHDKRCPLLLGKGLGPLCYQYLYDLWKQLETKDLAWFQSNYLGSRESTELLLNRMGKIKPNQVHEGLLSTMISITYQKLIPLFAETGSEPFDYAHQVYAPSKSSSHVDFAAINAHGDSLTVHSLLEIKWSNVEKEFPESEVTACGSLFRSTGASHQPWIPVFVLSKSHLQIGVAFAFVGGRWAYSEIFKLDKVVDFSCRDEGDVLHNLRFALFFYQSAEYHRSCKVLCDTKHLVDGKGKVLLQDADVLGYRVIEGVDESSKRKILKFYACKADAEKALAVEKSLPGYDGVAQLAEGCASDGMHAVLDDYHPSSEVTYRHLINLTTKVNNLRKVGWVQGDLRLPNVIFGPGDIATIIDWEWAGLVGKTKFPLNVRRISFGPLGSAEINAGELIPANFDFLCLADLLNQLHCSAAAVRAPPQPLPGP